MRPGFRDRTGKDMFMRIGMNTGDAVVGNMGSRKRFDYTMLGDSVNLAARLEGVNKQFGTYTMVSKSTYDIVETEFPARELARVAVVGRKEPVTVFEPMMSKDSESKQEVLNIFSRGLALFYEGSFQEALDIFTGISDQDPPASRYADKCKLLLKEQPGSWKGVWVMTEK
jgi:adenylate cyclase